MREHQYYYVTEKTVLDQISKYRFRNIKARVKVISGAFLHPQPVFKVSLMFTSVLDETERSVSNCSGRKSKHCWKVQLV